MQPSARQLGITRLPSVRRGNAAPSCLDTGTAVAAQSNCSKLAGITPETLCHWMGWEHEPYVTFQHLVRKAEADLEARMVQILTRHAEVRPELALALLERKFPERWAKVPTIAPNTPPPLSFDLGSMLQRILARRPAERAGQAQLPAATIIDTHAQSLDRPHDPRPPKPVPPRLVPPPSDDGARST